MEEEATNDNGILVLEPAQKEHSGLYECQGLDLETTASLQSDQQELLVNCEDWGPRTEGPGWGKREPAPPCPEQADTTAVFPDVSDVLVSPAAPERQEGSSLTLTCEAESNQALEFQWLREKVPRWPWGCGVDGAGSDL